MPDFKFPARNLNQSNSVYSGEKKPFRMKEKEDPFWIAPPNVPSHFL